jgi:hypothetical protein
VSDDHDDDFVERSSRTHRKWPATETDSERRRRVLDKIYRDDPYSVPVVAESMSDRAKQSAATRDAESERMRQTRERVRTSPYGSPVTAGARRERDRASEITAPYEVLDRDPRPEELEIVRRSRRDSSDPITVQDAAKIINHLEKLVAHRLEESSERERTLQAEGIAKIEKLIATPPHQAVIDLQAAVKAILAELSGDGKEPGIREHVKDQVRSRKKVNWMLVFLAPFALAGFVAGLGALWSRSSTETKAQIKLEQAFEKIDALNQEIGRYRQLVFPSTTKGP